MSDFGPLTRQPSLATRVSDELQEAIASGRFRAGERLPSERDMSERFGVSRTVIREAIRTLYAKGVLEVSEGRGTQIATVSASRVTEALEVYLRGAQSQDLLRPEHIAEVRETLETRLVELACSRATDDDIAAITAAHERMAAARDPETAATHDAEFHRLLARSTHNALMLTLIESINATMKAIRSTSLSVEGRLPVALDEHAAILDAVRARDAEAARRAMRHHLDGSERFYDAGAEASS
ncbi:MAG: FadR/GntR family transcriptional regulator [Microbacterium enclense]